MTLKHRVFDSYPVSVSRCATHFKPLVIGSGRLVGKFSPYTVDEEGHRIEVAWKELPVSVLRTQFDFMHNRVGTSLLHEGAESIPISASFNL
ncbi:hypothetical protein TNCV_2726261 [Trichonephila clavipes]|nr:hypothetical protein TNCV_2726261 [Trichonephila clavipes]